MNNRLDNLPYRPCVGLMLLNAENKVFVARRLNTTIEAWQMPQGGIDADETPQQALFREMQEEIGTANAEILQEHDGWLHYDLPDHLIGKAWKGRYRGQRMKWYLLRYLGQDDEIDLETHQPEFSRWKWVEMDQIVHAIVDFKRPLYRDLIAYFRPFILGNR